MTGLIVFIAAVNGAVDNKLTLNKTKEEEPPFKYNYGISFFCCVFSFLMQECNGICNIYWYIDYYRKYRYEQQKGLNINRKSIDLALFEKSRPVIINEMPRMPNNKPSTMLHLNELYEIKKDEQNNSKNKKLSVDDEYASKKNQTNLDKLRDIVNENKKILEQDNESRSSKPSINRYHKLKHKLYKLESKKKPNAEIEPKETKNTSKKEEKNSKNQEEKNKNNENSKQAKTKGKPPQDEMKKSNKNLNDIPEITNTNKNNDDNLLAKPNIATSNSNINFNSKRNDLGLVDTQSDLANLNYQISNIQLQSGTPAHNVYFMKTAPYTHNLSSVQVSNLNSFNPIFKSKTNNHNKPDTIELSYQQKPTSLFKNQLNYVDFYQNHPLATTPTSSNVSESTITSSSSAATTATSSSSDTSSTISCSSLSEKCNNLPIASSLNLKPNSFFNDHNRVLNSKINPKLNSINNNNTNTNAIRLDKQIDLEENELKMKFYKIKDNDLSHISSLATLRNSPNSISNRNLAHNLNESFLLKKYPSNDLNDDDDQTKFKIYNKQRERQNSFRNKGQNCFFYSHDDYNLNSTNLNKLIDYKNYLVNSTSQIYSSINKDNYNLAKNQLQLQNANEYPLLKNLINDNNNNNNKSVFKHNMIENKNLIYDKSRKSNRMEAYENYLKNKLFVNNLDDSDKILHMSPNTIKIRKKYEFMSKKPNLAIKKSLTNLEKTPNSNLYSIISPDVTKLTLDGSYPSKKEVKFSSKLISSNEKHIRPSPNNVIYDPYSILEPNLYASINRTSRNTEIQSHQNSRNRRSMIQRNKSISDYQPVTKYMIEDSNNVFDINNNNNDNDKIMYSNKNDNAQADVPFKRNLKRTTSV